MPETLFGRTCGGMGDPIRSAELVSRLLRYGDAATRRRLAADVAGDPALVAMLAETARRSDEDLDLRLRCLEVLGRAVEGAEGALGLAVLTALFGAVASETVLGL